jgi:ribosomal-protein-alanine N-acetyltransferase
VQRTRQEGRLTHLIRAATPANIPAMIELDQQCATAAHWKEAQYRQAFQPESAARLVLVAESPAPPASHPDAGGEVVGFLVARDLAGEWELENVIVAPTARRQGLGKRLLKALFSVARETGGGSVFLEVRESNAAARTLYERAGFKRTGGRKGYYTDPIEDAVLYRLNL